MTCPLCGSTVDSCLVVLHLQEVHSMTNCPCGELYAYLPSDLLPAPPTFETTKEYWIRHLNHFDIAGTSFEAHLTFHLLGKS